MTTSVPAFTRSAVLPVRLHYDAVRESRKLKPQIPELGQEGIPIRHELELERRLEG